MRDKIRIPVDVELSTKLVALESCDIEGPVKISIQTEKGAKFNKVTRIAISLVGNENAIVIVPKQRREQRASVPQLPNITVTERKVRPEVVLDNGEGINA